MAIRIILILCLHLGVYFYSVGQVEWVNYSRKEIGLPTIETTQKVSWTKLKSTEKLNQAAKIATEKSLQVISEVIEEDLEKITFEEVDILKADVIENIEFDYRELAKVDVKCLNRLRVPYLNGMQAIAQFHDGRMIFGGFDLICIYDGYKMEVFKSSKNYIFNEIFSIVIDSKNKAWIASDAGIAYYENGKFFKSSNLEVGKVWNYWQSPKNEIYVATCYNGVYILGENQTKHIFKKDKIQEVLDFIKTKDGKLWFGLDNGLAYKKDGVWYEYPFGIIQGSVRSLKEAGDKLFIGTFQDGLYCLENDSVFKIDAPALNHRSIYNIKHTENELVIPLYGLGILFLSEDLSFYKIKEIDGLVGNNTIKVFDDTFGNIWCTDILNGISKLRNTKLIPINYNIPDFKCRKSITLSDSKWFFSNDAKIYKKVEDDYFVLNYKGDGILQDGDALTDEKIVISNYAPGVQLYEQGKIRLFNTNENDYEATFKTPRFGKNNEIYFTNYLEEVRMFLNDSVFNLSIFPLLKDRRVKQCVSARDKSFGVSFNNAIAFFEKDKFILYNEDNGLLSNFIYSMMPWKENQFCVVMDKGVQIFSKGKIIKTYSFNIFAQGIDCWAKVIDNNQILLLSNLEVKVLKLKDFEIEEKVLDVPKGSYLIDYLIIEDNDSLVSLKKNTYCYNFYPFRKERQKGTPTLEIENIFLNDKQIDKNELSITQNDQIAFHLSAISLLEKGKILYTIIKDGANVLEGVIYKRDLKLSALQKGNYTIKMHLEANDTKSKVLKYNFNVLPFWYETIWFYVLLFFITVISIFLYMKYKIRKAEKNEERLKNLVSLKTKELDNEKQLVEKELQEKDILLKEINHRVKNNMQMVSSLLQLQAGKSNDEVAKKTLKLAGERIKSLALAHQRLYLSEDYSNLMLSDYLNLIISNLLNNLEIKSIIEIDDDLSLDIEKAQAIGLVLNELITNSIQHAWKENDENKIIKIIISKNEIQWNMQYKDNGKGLSEFNDLENSSSLGFTLIKSFVKRQLNGTFEIKNEDGFCFTIDFKP